MWLRGEHDASTVPDLVQLFARTISLDHADLVVDLSNVEFMDASTVGVMVRARVFLGEHSRQMTVRGPSANARKVLDLCGLSHLIGPEPSAESLGRRAGPE